MGRGDRERSRVRRDDAHFHSELETGKTGVVLELVDHGATVIFVDAMKRAAHRSANGRVLVAKRRRGFGARPRLMSQAVELIAYRAERDSKEAGTDDHPALLTDRRIRIRRELAVQLVRLVASF